MPLRTQHSAAQNAGKRLEQELNMAVSRLRQLGGAVVVEELPGAIGDNSPFADEVDDIQATASRDIGLATRELVVERVNRLSAALHRLHDGEYGMCVECGAPVSAARTTRHARGPDLRPLPRRHRASRSPVSSKYPEGVRPQRRRRDERRAPCLSAPVVPPHRRTSRCEFAATFLRGAMTGAVVMGAHPLNSGAVLSPTLCR